MDIKRIYDIEEVVPAEPLPDPEKDKTPAIPTEEEIIADGSAGAFEATEMITDEDLHPPDPAHKKNGKDYY